MVDITLPLAFIAGVVSFLSPCVLPLIPAYLTFLAGTSANEVKAHVPGVRMRIFLNGVLFVLGFSVVFAGLGVLLQSVLSSVAYDTRQVLGWIGGLVIIFFGLMLMGVIKIPALQAEHKFSVKRTRYQYLTSFVFGSAFAVGWTPCVGAVLGGVLTLAVTQPEAAFPLMLAYSLGLGIPFLLAAAFISQATGFIERISPHMTKLNFIFGIVLIILGILVFTNTLSVLSSLFPVPELFMESLE